MNLQKLIVKRASMEKQMNFLLGIGVLNIA